MSNLSSKAEYKLKQKALKYVLVDDELFKRRQERLLLKCVNDIEAKRIMHKVHEDICGAHKSGPKMRWLIHRYEYYRLPSQPIVLLIQEEVRLVKCIDHSKNCQPRNYIQL